MPAFIAVAVAALAVGIALGWYLRSITTWCPECGDAMQCSRCSWRPCIRVRCTGDQAGQVMPPASVRTDRRARP